MNFIFKKKNELSRRQFLAKSGCAAMGLTGVVNTLAHLRLMQGALNAQAGGSGGYKALVCVFLAGGNDSNNMLMPTGTNTARSDYVAGRGGLALPQVESSGGALALNATSLSACDPLGGYLGGLGVHPRFTHVRSMFDAGELAFVANVGTLAYPGMTRATYASTPKPERLYSHSDQQVQWQSSIPDRPFSSGWGGRIADFLDPIHNTSSARASMSVSIAGVNSFQVSASGQATPYVMSSGGISTLAGYGTNYSSAVNNPQLLFESSNYKTTQEGRRLKMFDDVMRLTDATLLENAYNDVRINSRSTEGKVSTALQVTAAGAGTTLDSYFTNAFVGSGYGENGELTKQLKMVARLIAGRAALGNTRQIFFVQQAGYDTHASQLAGQNDLLGTLNGSLKGFRDALQSLGVYDDVVTFTASDFTRTFAPNKTDDTAGSDHAWGGHALVMGGAVNGQRVYGKYPVLRLGDAANSIDAVGNRGLWIPSTPVDQYAAVLARWLGVDPTALGTIFPNLSRFVTIPNITSGNMDFLQV